MSFEVILKSNDAHFKSFYGQNLVIFKQSPCTYEEDRLGEFGCDEFDLPKVGPGVWDCDWVEHELFMRKECEYVCQKFSGEEEVFKNAIYCGAAGWTSTEFDLDFLFYSTLCTEMEDWELES